MLDLGQRDLAAVAARHLLEPPDDPQPAAGELGRIAGPEPPVDHRGAGVAPGRGSRGTGAGPARAARRASSARRTSTPGPGRALVVETERRRARRDGCRSSTAPRTSRRPGPPGCRSPARPLSTSSRRSIVPPSAARRSGTPTPRRAAALEDAIEHEVGPAVERGARPRSRGRAWRSSAKAGSSTAAAPTVGASSRAWRTPVIEASGLTRNSRSSAPSPVIARKHSTPARSERPVCTTPFGVDVVPEVNTTSLGASGSGESAALAAGLGVDLRDRDGVDHAGRPGRGHDEPRRGRSHRVLDLARARRDVRQHGDGAQPDDGPVGDDRLPLVRGHEDDGIAGADAPRVQPRAAPSHRRVELAVGDACPGGR